MPPEYIAMIIMYSHLIIVLPTLLNVSHVIIMLYVIM